MKKLIIFFLLLASSAWAGGIEIARVSPCVLGGSAETAAPSGCDADVDYVGESGTGGAYQSYSAGIMYCNALATPTCYGNLNTAYIVRKSESTPVSFYLCVYEDSDDDNSADGDDTKIGCTEKIDSSVGGTISRAITGTLTTGKDYYVCLYVDDGSANSPQFDTDADTVTIFYKTGLPEPPDNLGGFSSSSGRNRSVWATIGE